MPFYTYQFEVNLPPQIVSEKLQAVTEKRAGLFLLGGYAGNEASSNLFWGSVRDTSFALTRRINNRDSFQPQVFGRIQPSGVGSKLRVIMYLHPLVAIFMGFWLTATGRWALLEWRLSAPLGMFVFGLALTLGGFYSEVPKTRALIESAIKADAYKPVG